MELHKGELFKLKLSHLHFYLLLAYIGGILFWYQWHSYYLFLLLPLAPALFLFSKKVKLVALIIISFLLGNLRTSYIPNIDKGPISGKATIYSIPKKTLFGTKALVKVETLEKSFFIDAYLPNDENIALFDQYIFQGIAKDLEHYHNFDNIPTLLKNYEDEKRILQIKEKEALSYYPLFRKLSTLREEMKNHLFKNANNNGAFFSEVLFGEKMLSNSERRLFSVTGTAHLLSISGIHFATILFFSYIFVYLLQTLKPSIVYKLPRPYLTLILAIPFVVFYGFISGLSIPAFRAFLAFFVFITFMLFSVDCRPLTLLSLVGLVFLLFDPTLIFSKSFQMSFLAIFVLLLLTTEILQKGTFKRLKKRKTLYYFLSLAVTSFTVSLFLLPITQNLSPQSLFAGVIANTFAIPIFTFFILPFALIALFFSLISPALFSILFSIPKLGCKLLYATLSFIEPLTKITTLNLYFSFGSAILYFAFLTFLFFGRGKIKYIVSLFAFIALIFSFSPKEKGPFITFLDVGQGDCALLQTEGGKTIFVDMGGNIYDSTLFNRAYRPFLSQLRIGSIDAVILSHYHPDHYRALEELLNYYDVKEVYCPKSSDFATILDLWQKSNFQLKLISEKRAIKIDDVDITLIPNNDERFENNRSLWAIIKAKDKIFLFSGDAEKPVLKKMVNRLKGLSPDIFKVPHHGSKSSFLKEFYLAIRPKRAVISVGRRNIWKLPSKEVVDFFKANKIETFRTDLDGQLLFTFNGENINVKKALEEKL